MKLKHAILDSVDLAIESILNTIKYWHRLQNIHESTLVHQAFNEMKHSNLENSWYATVQSLWTRSNIRHDMAVKQVIKSIKTELQGQFLSFWKKKLFDDTNKTGGNKQLINLEATELIKTLSNKKNI